ncbi:hypothetical protein ACHAP5_009400 [Fusarium lateritium]
MGISLVYSSWRLERGLPVDGGRQVVANTTTNDRAAEKAPAGLKAPANEKSAAI